MSTLAWKSSSNQPNIAKRRPAKTYGGQFWPGQHNNHCEENGATYQSDYTGCSGVDFSVQLRKP